MRWVITVLVLAATFVGAPARAHKIITINGGDCPACPMCPACPADDDQACLSTSQCTQVSQAVRQDAPLWRRCRVARDPRWRHMRVLKCRVVYSLP